MAVLDINWKPTPRELKQFAGIWLPLAIATLGGMLLWKGWITSLIAYRIWGIGATISVVSWLFPPVALLVYQTWMVLAFPIGWTMSHLLMGLIYFGLITPMGLVMRLFGRDAMGRRRRVNPCRRSRPSVRWRSKPLAKCGTMITPG